MKSTGSENLDKVGLYTLETISKAEKFNRWMYDNIRPFIKGSVLELGCGIGNITDFLVKDFSVITLSDYNPEYCNLIREKYKFQNTVKEVIQLDLQNILYTEEYKEYKHTFDTIILLNVIEHLEDDIKAVQLCYFLLKPGGHFIILAPAYKLLYSPFDRELGHFRRYSDKSLISLLTSNNYSVIHTKYFNVVGMAGWFIFNTIGRRKRLKNIEMSAFNFLVPIAKVIDKLLGNKTGLSIISVGKK